MADIALTSKPKARVRFAFLLNLTLLGLLLLMWALLSATTDSFMTANNIRTGVPGR
jgi:ribose transport system permease protein